MNRDDIKEFLELAAGLKKSSRMLVEEEGEDLFGDDEGGGDEGGDDEAADDAGDEGGDEGGDTEEEEEEEEVDVSKEEEIELSKSLDDSLNALFIDIETDALKSAVVQKQEESYSLKAALLSESDHPDLDVEKFASETARIIKNADVLLDIEEIIMSKARDYLLNKYDEELEKKFLDIMMTRFNIDSRTESEKQDDISDIPTPIAVGASGGEGGGG